MINVLTLKLKQWGTHNCYKIPDFLLFIVTFIKYTFLPLSKKSFFVRFHKDCYFSLITVDLFLRIFADFSIQNPITSSTLLNLFDGMMVGWWALRWDDAGRLVPRWLQNRPTSASRGQSKALKHGMITGWWPQSPHDQTTGDGKISFLFLFSIPVHHPKPWSWSS